MSYSSHAGLLLNLLLTANHAVTTESVSSRSCGRSPDGYV